MMACEEAWLLGKAIRSIDPQAVLVLGPVPTAGQDEVFKNPSTASRRSSSRRKKSPTPPAFAGCMEMLGGPTATWDDLLANSRREFAKLKGGWIVGGYLSQLDLRRHARCCSRAASASCRIFCPTR